MAKDSGTAYILWLGCCIGLCGLHRFYLDSPLLGIIYLCTGGLFGIGQLLDLFFIPSIVSSLNKGGNVVIQNTNVQNPGLGMGVGMVAGAMMQQSMQQQQPMMMQQPMMQQPMMMQQPVYVQQPVMQQPVYVQQPVVQPPVYMQQPVVQPPVQQPPVQVIVESKQ